VGEQIILLSVAVYRKSYI